MKLALYLLQRQPKDRQSRYQICVKWLTSTLSISIGLPALLFLATCVARADDAFGRDDGSLGQAPTTGSELDDVDDRVEFGRDVRPILAKHCFTCHGPDPDARQADLRLDTQDGSRGDLGGYQAIMPRDPDASELITRITSEDDDVRMPP
ncbi:MAG: hypothetical protein HKN47_21505, partial [Pirellulaceae bacterium]|nr:hypothetical protein [Pirellulaceae bacterium]